MAEWSFQKYFRRKTNRHGLSPRARYEIIDWHIDYEIRARYETGTRYEIID